MHKQMPAEPAFHLEALTAEVAQLVDEARALRDAVFEFREKVRCGVVNRAPCAPAGSDPGSGRDPHVSPDVSTVLDQAPSGTDQLHLCCENSHLIWRGTIDNAIVECQNCGFVLSDDGQIIDWLDPEEIKYYQEYLKDETALCTAIPKNPEVT